MLLHNLEIVPLTISLLDSKYWAMFYTLLMIHKGFIYNTGHQQMLNKYLLVYLTQSQSKDGICLADICITAECKPLCPEMWVQSLTQELFSPNKLLPASNPD